MFINGLLEHYKPETVQDVQEMLRDLLGDTLQGLLEAEIKDELGYSKYDYSNRKLTTVNGNSKKNVVSSMREIGLDIPRDHTGEFESQIVQKH